MLSMQTIEAQLTTATVSGTVADITGAVIPGVSISVLQVETGTERSTVTDDEGRYRVSQLDPLQPFHCYYGDRMLMTQS